MADVRIIREWFGKAEEDYQFAISNLKEKNSFYAQICFHFHQSAEKYLKTYIVANELEFKKIHDLIELLRICKEKDIDFSKLKEDCEFLNPFYIDTRYPVHWRINYNKDTAIKAKEKVENIRKFIKKKLSNFIKQKLQYQFGMSFKRLWQQHVNKEKQFVPFSILPLICQIFYKK